MAWGYVRDDGTQAGLWLALAMQVALFVVLVSPRLRELQRRWSARKLTTLAALAMTGSTGVFHLAFPVFDGGSLTAALLTLLVVLPASVVNSVIFAVRLAVGTSRSYLGVLVIAVNGAFWAVELFVASP